MFLTALNMNRNIILEIPKYHFNSPLKYLLIPEIFHRQCFPTARLAWLVICILALTFGIFIVLYAWFEFQFNPIITVTESTQYPIYKFVFPAVTICSLNGISKKLAYQIASDFEKPKNMTEESLAKELTLLFQLAHNDNQNIPKENYEKLQKILNENKRSSEEVYRLISPRCHTLLKKCMWKGKAVRCDTIFETIKTSIGYCCSFNYFALKNHLVSGTFLNKSPKKPRRISACGHESGLEVFVNNEPEDYFATHIPSTGFRVLIHDSYDFPDWAIQNILCEINTNNFIGIDPTIITASKHIRKMQIFHRKCLFLDERDLDNFAAYTFHNCMVECRMTLISEHCNCVPFYLHNKQGSENNICTLEDITCIAQHENLIHNNTFNPNSEKCNCLPDCEGAFYIPEISNGILDATYSTNEFSIDAELPMENHTIVRVFFNDLAGTRHRKDGLFRWHSLIGYYGGIMGLLTGFSFITIIEIFYFATVRLVTDLIKRKKISRKEGIHKVCGARSENQNGNFLPTIRK